MGQLLNEPKWQKLFGFGAAYVVSGWLILQMLEVLGLNPALTEWVPGLVFILLLLGFPLSLSLVWTQDKSEFIRNILLRSFLISIAAIFLIGIDPFGYGTATNENSNRVFSRILAPFYERQDSEIAVVILIDDQFLEEAKLTWPMPLGVHARILNKIANYKPKAIFLDFMYRQSRGGDSGFADFAEEMSKISAGVHGRPGIPLYLGAARPIKKCTRNGDEEALNGDEAGRDRESAGSKTEKSAEEDCITNSEEALNGDVVEELRGHVRPVLIGWSAQAMQYPLLINLDKQNDRKRENGASDFTKFISRILASISGQSSAEPKETEPKFYYDTPAMALFRVFCELEVPPLRNSCGPLSQEDQQGHLPSRHSYAVNFSKDLSLQWGSSISAWQEIFTVIKDTNTNGDGVKCRDFGSGFFAQAREFGIQFFTALFAGAFAGNTRNKDQLCPYHLTLSPATLFFETGGEQAALERILNNAYVFVGADITGINDSIVAPAHGQLPGVFAHAMAFDNLVKYGSGYYSEAPTLVAMLTELMMIFFVISTTRIVYIGYGKRCKSLLRSKKAATRWGRRRPLLWAWLMIGLIGLVPLAATIILYLGYKLPPANWVGVLSLMIFSALFVFQDTARFLSMQLSKKFWLS